MIVYKTIKFIVWLVVMVCFVICSPIYMIVSAGMTFATTNSYEEYKAEMREDGGPNLFSKRFWTFVGDELKRSCQS